MDPERLFEEQLKLSRYMTRTDQLMKENKRREFRPWLWLKWRKVEKEIDFRIRYAQARYEELDGEEIE